MRTVKTSRLESFKTNDQSVAKITPAEHIVHLLTRVVGYALIATAETLDGARSALIPHKVNKPHFPRRPALRGTAGRPGTAGRSLKAQDQLGVQQDINVALALATLSPLSGAIAHNAAKRGAPTSIQDRSNAS